MKTNFPLGILVLTSPLGMGIHYIWQGARGVYPPEADSIGIPIMGYMVIVFPVFVVVWGLSLKRKDPGLHIRMWNSERTWASVLSLAVCVWPIGVSWVLILCEAVVTIAVASLVYSVVMLCVVVLVRSRMLGD